MTDQEIEALKEQLRIEAAALQNDHESLHLYAVSALDAVTTLAQLQAENAELLRLLAYAVKKADGLHDECHGGQIDDDPLIEAARQKIAAKPS